MLVLRGTVQPLNSLSRCVAGVRWAPWKESGPRGCGTGKADGPAVRFAPNTGSDPARRLRAHRAAFDGDPDVGKSVVTMDLAARISTLPGGRARRRAGRGHAGAK
jgi:hypothetical protein